MPCPSGQTNSVAYALAYSRVLKQTVEAPEIALSLTAFPAWLVWVAACAWALPLRVAVGHAVVLGLLSVLAVEVALLGPVKIAFTCSHLGEGTNRAALRGGADGGGGSAGPLGYIVFSGC